MRRLVVFLGVLVALTLAIAAFDWWVDPFGEVWKPGALADARAQHCLVSQELIGLRYYSFKLDVFRHRPTRTFVVGSSRVLKISSRPGEATFANLGYPGTSPETLLKLFRALPAEPAQTVYLGVEAFWFNSRYVVPDTDPSDSRIAEYLLSRSTLQEALTITEQAHVILWHRWHRSQLGPACVIDRISPAIEWKVDGSRVWAWELDPKRFPPFGAAPFDGNLATWRNGYYADWRSLDARRLEVLDQVLALAHDRGWRVVGFAPPEPARMLRVLDTDPRLAGRWRDFMRLMPGLFEKHGGAWIGLGTTCPKGEFPDAFHTDAACSARLRGRLDEAARHLH